MTVPKYPSAPIFPAAAIGPGVGGTSVCVAYKPFASATDMEATATFARLANAFLKLDKLTKPESQKTGMDTIKPIMLMASCGLLGPTILNTTSAIRNAAPSFSKMVPIIVPKTMTSPMLVISPPKLHLLYSTI